MNLLKIVIYTPVSHADKIRLVLGKSGAGHIGNYDFCSFSISGIGRFRPLKNTKPFIGKLGKIEEVEEEKIETVCEESKLKEIWMQLRKCTRMRSR